ncbi:rho GTPase-activating protein 31-like [Seriola dumerili]|uniref:rho GTPase-activating protein 31-like n=1 Tax=Seriola dumerili TaxID=41447 RepID=UPI000BBE80FC|nr:rho GTPase-activating protein 31-like [Seriola dumerili]XP_022613577.1 rho GTPase-activating protein 31-like [Seriola dumerili]
MRRVRRRGGNKEKVFGCDLLEHLTASSQEIPQVLRCCSEFVEHHGVVDGIYRLSGVSSNIQKLRGEFENDGNPDLNKDVYLQDIHCVSSLCKAYFRELPNPLLTYQLYDKFAEAVAIQLEEERLVKIRDVLKELPTLHYRTLEFLMHHLVRMASHSSETNMHARNLAIVWAPNLLRSKDIEATGFNGTAAFMEVRVQSIVVEFILTHVPQLFPEQGVSSERRKSLPSPSAESSQDEGFFKSVSSQPCPSFGNISPGDGPIAIRPYHAIIEGTDKRKGSLKGRKWMSIFNIGGRFPDPRRRHKHSAKEKDRASLRPARSMDSLSSPLYPNEGSRRSTQRPPSINTSPNVTPSPQPCSEAPASSGAMGGSEYAVTYRRGTGLVSGGTQGTYTALDPEGLGSTGNETLQSRSPGLSTKAGWRAAMHITGPTLVTVPLHITSNLALGVLQGGGSNRVIHRGRDKDGGDRVEGKEEGDKVERKESREMEMKEEEEGRKVEEEEKDSEGIVDVDENAAAAGGVGEEEFEGAIEEEKREEEVREDSSWKPELVIGGVSKEQRAKSVNSNPDDEDAENNDQYVDYSSDYMEMKGVERDDPQPAVTQPEDTCAFDAPDILNSTEVEGDNQELFGYVQDNFDFLDQMDCSVLDHMDCSTSYQVNEFSVEPPGHSDDEYEVMVQAPPPPPAAEPLPHPETPTQSPNELKPHRPLSLDLHSRHTKSLSLPYMTSPVHGPDESSSEEEDEGDHGDNDDYSSEEDESMFYKSLPADFLLSSLSGLELDTDAQDSCTQDRLPVDPSQSSEEGEFETLHSQEPAAGDQEQGGVIDEEDREGLEGKQMMNKEEEDTHDKQGEQPENHMQSMTAEEDVNITEDVKREKEKHPTSDTSSHCCMEFRPPSDDDIDELSTIKVEDEKEVVENPHSDHPPCHTDIYTTQEIGDVSLEESREDLRTCDGGDMKERHSDEGGDGRVCKEREAICEEKVLEIKESDEKMLEDPTEDGEEGIADKKDEEKMHEGGKEQDSEICSSEIWEELEDVICEVIEDEESEQAERDGVAGVEKVGEEEEQKEKVSGDKIVQVEEGGANKTEVKPEVEEDSDPEIEQESEERETSELGEAIQRKHAVNKEACHRHGEEVVSKETEKENCDQERAHEQLRSPPSVDKQIKEARSDMKKPKCEDSDSSQGAVGRKLVVSKNPKVYQVKAVPVVPPKPQHCKITALTLRQQQQQRERRDADRGRETRQKVQTEQDRVCAAEQGKDGGERERERRRDGDEGAARDASRNSPHSMCFDEAVAIATMRREKEKECEKEKERQRDWGSEV